MHAKEQALRLRKLIAAGVLVLPNAWDVGSAAGRCVRRTGPSRNGLFSD